jgi:hypothetical protein
MGTERDESIERHRREQRLGEELLRDAMMAQHNAHQQLDPDDVMPDWCDSVVLCATHTIGRWKIVGNFTYELSKAPAHTLIEHKDPEVLRSVLRVRGYWLHVGRLLQEHHTGIEVWTKRGVPQHFVGNLACPACGHIVSGAGPADGADPSPPTEDDYSVCIYCAAALRFIQPEGQALTVRLATPKDLAELDEQTMKQLYAAMDNVRRMREGN